MQRSHINYACNITPLIIFIELRKLSRRRSIQEDG